MPSRPEFVRCRLVGEVLGLALELLPLDKAALQSKAARRQQAAADARQDAAAAAAERRTQGQAARPWSLLSFLQQLASCSGEPRAQGARLRVTPAKHGD